MSFREAESIVRELAAHDGVDGCALVDADSGMAWFHAGRFPGVERLSEAAVEFWRVQHRLAGHFSGIGKLQSVVYTFSGRMVALLPCCERPTLVLVCIAEKAKVSWTPWGESVARLKRVVARAAADGARPG